MSDKINASIVLILRGNMKRLRLQLEASEEWDGFDAHRILNDIGNEAYDLLAKPRNLTAQQHDFGFIDHRRLPAFPRGGRVHLPAPSRA